ncbi:uncharacterized protein LOC107620832 [Arachis ipaensis]|uniref:uncharacterized protein LOC107620832 n=1 Tax=Arachis ipaensis TaxID=130454 RepID=UPI0007AF7AF6|nr:uncharacterized protein LOC107620832 [Arachis ipaensis]
MVLTFLVHQLRIFNRLGWDSSSSMLAVSPACRLVESPSFAVGMASSPPMIPDFVGDGESDRVENAMREDDSDEEPIDIVGDKTSSTFLNLELGSYGATTGRRFYLWGQRLHDRIAPTEFQIGQFFQNKEEAVLSVKSYNIHRGVKYKDTWEVRRYNRPHTCLATLISSDHQQLDYHVICVMIFLLVRSDAPVTIKGLQQATEATYNFRPTYRKSTIVETIIVLKTSPVRVGDQIDESTIYFHHIFWIFPLCIEAFRHCKPMVSIDGTHLYAKYGALCFWLSRKTKTRIFCPLHLHLWKEKMLSRGLLVIFDRHNGNNVALEVPDSDWLLPRDYQAFYICHIAANFSLSFKN